MSAGKLTEQAKGADFNIMIAPILLVCDARIGRRTFDLHCFAGIDAQIVYDAGAE